MATYRTALVACARWEEASIGEWLEYHRSIGFDHVYLYSNDDDRTALLQAVTPYVLGDTPYVTFRHWPERGNQINIYLHFLEHFKHETEWYAFLDIDEFFVFKNSNNVHAFMRDYLDSVDCLYFNWVCFGNNGKLTRDEGSTLMSYVRRAAVPDVHTKMLCRADKIDAAVVRREFAASHVSFWHFLDTYGLEGLRCRDVLNRSMDGYSADFPATATAFVDAVDVGRDILDRAYIAHYQFKSEADFMRRWRRGGSAYAAHWREVFETGEYRNILAHRNDVHDDYLARYWQHLTGAPAQVDPVTLAAARLADDAAADAGSLPKRGAGRPVDRPIGRMYGDAMGPLGICAIFKDEGPRLLEWIAYHLAIGFDHFVLFDNGSTDGGAALAAESPFKPFVTVLDWPQRPGQQAAYQHFCDHFAKSFEWVAFIDIDEFINPLEHNSIRDVLPRYDDASAVSLQWLTFGASGYAIRPPGLVIGNYKLRLPEDHARCSWVKPLVRTADLKGVTDGPHVMNVSGRICNTRGETVRPHSQIPRCHDVIVINHYYTKSKQDWEAKIRRGHAIFDNKRSYTGDDFDKHERAATVRDDRIMRFLPLVEQILAHGPARDVVPVHLGEAVAGAKKDATRQEDVASGAEAIGPVRAEGPVIHLVPNGGRLGNKMIQYMLALKLASLVPGSRIGNVDLPEWGISVPPIACDGQRLSLNIPQRFDMDGISRRMNGGEIRRLDYKGFGQRMENLLDRQQYRSVFQAPGHEGVGYGPEHLVCPVRSGDILRAPHADYVLTPVAFYQDVVAQTGLQPVFMGETGDSHYMRRLREAFPQAPVLPMGDVNGSFEIIRDFEIIRQSQNIVVGCSTFSWLAAWLSDAKQIIMPVNGMMNPRQADQVDLVPLDDQRYRFFLFPINHAVPDAAHAERHRLIDGLWREVSHEHLRKLIAEAPRVPRRIDAFLDLFDENYYLAHFPTVRKGIADGWLASGLAHFTKWGFDDGVGWWGFDLDERWYATQYPMAAFEVAQGDFADCRHHYAAIGRARGYEPRPAPARRGAEPAGASPAEAFAAVLHVTFRNCDAPVHFLSSLTLGGHHPDVVVAPDNKAVPGQPYVCVIAIWDLWRLDPRRCLENDVAHFSGSIDKALAYDVRRGRAVLALDLTNDGAPFARWAFDRIHETIDAMRLPARRVVWLSQNRAMQAAYEAAYKDRRPNLIRCRYYGSSFNRARCGRAVIDNFKRMLAQGGPP